MSPQYGAGKKYTHLEYALYNLLMSLTILMDILYELNKSVINIRNYVAAFNTRVGFPHKKGLVHRRLGTFFYTMKVHP